MELRGTIIRVQVTTMSLRYRRSFVRMHFSLFPIRLVTFSVHLPLSPHSGLLTQRTNNRNAPPRRRRAGRPAFRSSFFDYNVNDLALPRDYSVHMWFDKKLVPTVDKKLKRSLRKQRY